MNKKISEILKAIDDYSKKIVKTVDGRILEVENSLELDPSQAIKAHNMKNLIIYDLTSLKEAVMDLVELEGK